MRFTDPLFLFFFLPVACFLFYFAARKYGQTAALAVLFVASLMFYGQWGGRNFAILTCSFTVNYVIARCLIAAPDRLGRYRLALHLAGQVVNFGALFWFKYRIGLFQILTVATTGTQTYSLLDLAIPIGISFYTFQQAIFLLDTYYRRPEVVAYLGPMTGAKETLTGYLRYAVFVLFFPHLIIGPIIYLEEFEPQVSRRGFGKLLRRNLEVGLVLIVIGLFKKAVLADHLAFTVDPVFSAADAHAPIAALSAWLGALAYVAQLYFDFSGYSDIALGCARLFGIRYPVNFYSPLKAASISDFYRRWHITLTRAISRFLFTPLSLAGARFGIKHGLSPKPSTAVRLWIPLLVNFEVIALWHGAKLTFVVFGLFHGTWYVAETIVRTSKAWKCWVKRSLPRRRLILGRSLFTLLMLFSFALFRSSSLSSFGYLVENMFTGSITSVAVLSSLNSSLKWVAAAYVVIWFLPNSVEFLRRQNPGILTHSYRADLPPWLRQAWRPNWSWAVVLGAMFLMAIYFAAGQIPFLYQGF